MFKPVDPRPNFPKLEEDILKFWEENKIFEKSLAKNKDKEKFVFFEGPPTANAAPGIHHVEARAFKDIIPRYQTMRGKFVPRQAGWDTHGLPVELQIEKKLGISGKPQIEKLKKTVFESIKFFNEECRKSVWQFKEEWEKLTRRMGFWIDLENSYVTYENSYIEKLWGVIKQIWDKNLIYQGHKVVPYCPRCGTALSSHEVAQGYGTVTDNAVYVKFKLKKNSVIASDSEAISRDRHGSGEPRDDDEGDTYLLSWTTTPWTLPGNVALAVGKDIEYVVFEKDGENFIAAKGFNGEKGEKVIKGNNLVGLEYEPLFDIPVLKNDKSHRIYAADFVTITDGTGVVHTAVMYGEDDYELGEKEGLPKHHTVDEEGKFTDDLSAYGLAGLKVKDSPLPNPPPPLGEGIKAGSSPLTRDVTSELRGEDRGGGDKNSEQIIIDYLKSKNLLFKTEPYQHEYPFCWRCNTALLYYARNSWFIKMSALRKELLKNNDQINWIPEYIKEGRFGQWLSDIKDWAISRERYWGTPLPIWKCESCGEFEIIGSIEELKKYAVIASEAKQSRDRHGSSEPRDDNSFSDLHRPYVDEIKLKCEKCNGEMRRVPEVMDVWFDSGAMPFATETGVPADFISEAIDQTRGWFYTLLAISTLLDKGPAYKNVICLGHVLDAKGQKMSKSKGNAVSPWDMGDKYGFDIIRWYFYTVNQPGDGKLFDEKDLQVMQRRVQNILWNVYNYFVTYSNAKSANPNPNAKSVNVLDKWLSARLQQLVNVVTDSLDKYDAFHSSREIESFINDLSTWYLRRSRGRSDEGFFSTLHSALVQLSKLLAPFMPFMSEEIYKNLVIASDSEAISRDRHGSGEPRDDRSAESVHLSAWPETKKLTAEQEQLLKQMEQMRQTVEEVHAMRAKAGVKLRQPLAKLVVPPSLTLPTRGREKTGDDLSDSSPLVGEAGWGGNLLNILKSEVNVKEIVFGDKLELETELTEDLKLEGLTRELTRQIQSFRKESGLKIGEMAELHYHSDSDIINKALMLVDKRKTYLTAARPVQGLDGTEINVDGNKIVFKISEK